MAKRHTLVGPTQPSTPKQFKSPSRTNWELCIICQEQTDEPLQCPFRSNAKPFGIGYASLVEDLTQFKELHQMPMDIQLERLNDGDGLKETLMRNSAKWHKKCRLKFNKKMFHQQSRAEIASRLPLSDITQKVCTRSATPIPSQQAEPVCFFCNKPGGNEELHHASTMDIDKNVRRCATELGDTELIAKLCAGDMVAIKAKYHRNCLRSLYNRIRPIAPKDDDADQLHGIAFAELVVFMEERRADEDIAPVFKLSDLAHLYKTRLEQLGATINNRIHTTRLKERLLSELPELSAHSHGRDTLLLFEKDVGPALRKACERDNDAMYLVRAAQVVRREMFDTKFTFDGAFQADCQRDSVPPSLLALVNMILDGANIKHQNQFNNTSSTAAALSLSQLLVFNSVKHTRNTDSTSVPGNHSRDRETPLPLYLTLKIHAVTRNRSLIDTLFGLGICVSYDRFLQITADVANGLCQRFEIEQVVCPPKLRHGLFTTGAVDNVDHNPSSAMARDSFHGTGISLIQHPSHTNEGQQRDVVVIGQNVSPNKSVVPLPSEYTSVTPVAIRKQHFTAPAVEGPAKPPHLLAAEAAVREEYLWLRLVTETLQKKSINDWVSWSAYHADMQQAVMPPAAIISLLPLFVDSAHSVAMIRHDKTTVKTATQHLNLGQCMLRMSLLYTLLSTKLVELVKI
ncbi:uncharacterized protein LOC121413358 [Lytechinus variegatus]|uniref:uncharacterized protein LOC121413358 n=1 Tax=Lytechinus variegatus TaxID=7654 RepID=UPI001BB1DCFF|nr:uncharacterized protein LOC121413358 [Lytechinus variegatus]